MSSRTSKVPVDDDNSDEDADGVHDEGEEQVLGYKGQHQGRGGQDLGDQEQEHNQWQQDGDAECHLLPRLCWEVEDQHTEETDEHRGQDQVDSVEQSLPPDCDVESDVRLCGLNPCKPTVNFM